MCEVLKYLIAESGLLIPPGTLDEVHAMDHFTWQKFVDKIKGTLICLVFKFITRQALDRDSSDVK